MAMYQGTRAAVMTPDGLSDLFSTSSGVLQGDTLAPFLFVLLLDWVLRIALPSADDGFLLHRRVGRRFPEKRLCVLAYADDLALLSSTVEGAQRQLDRLVEVAASVGLSINAQKTEVLTVPADIAADIICRSADGRDMPLARCRRFTNLGGLVPSVEEDLQRRRGLAWAAFRCGAVRPTEGLAVQGSRRDCPAVQRRVVDADGDAGAAAGRGALRAAACGLSSGRRLVV